MALVKVGEKALQAANEIDVKVIKSKPKKKVLDEDSYAHAVEKIIVRDFYPDLPKMDAQANFLDALERNDTERLRQIHIKYGSKQSSDGVASDIYSTPATFETPSKQNEATTNPAERDKEAEGPTHNPEPSEKKSSIPQVGLDKFLSKTTSEDNAAFEEIMTEADRKHRQKHAWLYEQQDEKAHDMEQNLALPSIEQQAIEAAPASLQSWSYKPKNSVMYIPDGTELTADEKIEAANNKKEIVHKNTRFHETPFNMRKSAESIHQAASAQALALHGKIGHDGKELLPTATPRVNGYGFMGTPSPAPGVNESPMMTWGEIEGTPFRLDGSDTPVPSATPGPKFRIPAVPERERIGLALVEKAGKSHRAKKEQALKQVTATFSTPSPKFGSSSKSERLASMSPAAQRLASSRLGLKTATDKALRASYTPSPGHQSRTPRDRTPSLTPTPGGSTPGGSTPGGSTPGGSTPGGSTPGGRTRTSRTTSSRRNTPKRTAAPDSTSLTDNLLNLPKRPRAQEFF